MDNLCSNFLPNFGKNAADLREILGAGFVVCLCANFRYISIRLFIIR